MMTGLSIEGDAEMRNTNLSANAPADQQGSARNASLNSTDGHLGQTLHQT
jgi:hypothetical protein